MSPFTLLDDSCAPALLAPAMGLRGREEVQGRWKQNVQ